MVVNKKTATFIFYSLENLTPAEKAKFCRNFWGYKDKSTFGKYSYLRKGIMSDIPHIRIAPSLFIVLEKDRSRTDQIFQKFNLNPFVRTILLEKEDIEVLSR